MRIYYDIDLMGRSITRRELHGEEIVRAGRYLIAKTLLELGAATVDPLSPANPLIFSAGPLPRPSFFHANPPNGGRQSPLPGGIQEAERRRALRHPEGPPENARLPPLLGPAAPGLAPL